MWLKISTRSLEYHMAAGKLPFRKVGYGCVFYRSELKEFRDKYLRRGGELTIAEICNMYGCSEKTVRYNLLIKRNVEPVGLRSGARTYSKATVNVIAKFEGWERVTDIS